MRKLPVFATFGNALKFAIGNYFTVFRLSWFPLVAYFAAMVALGLVMQNALFDEMMQSERPDPRFMFRHLDDFAFVYATMMILQVIAFSAVAVAIHKVILFDDRKPGDYFVFAFGRTEFLFVLMVALSFLAVLAVLAAIMTPVIYVISNGDFASFFAKFEDWPHNMPDLVQSGDFGLIMGGYFAGWLVLIYLFLRLALWPPAVVATRRLALGEAWALTRGNVLRLLGLFILAVFVMWIVMASFMFAFVMGGLHMMPIDQAQTVRDATGPFAMRHMRYPFAPFGPLFLLGYLFLYVFVTGFTVALLSYSYKALKGYDAKEPIPQEG